MFVDDLDPSGPYLYTVQNLSLDRLLRGLLPVEHRRCAERRVGRPRDLRRALVLERFVKPGPRLAQHRELRQQ